MTDEEHARAVRAAADLAYQAAYALEKALVNAKRAGLVVKHGGGIVSLTNEAGRIRAMAIKREVSR